MTHQFTPQHMCAYLCIIIKYTTDDNEDEHEFFREFRFEVTLGSVNLDLIYHYICRLDLYCRISNLYSFFLFLFEILVLLLIMSRNQLTLSAELS